VLLLIALQLGTLPDPQFLALKYKISSGSPRAISADLRTLPATTTLPIILQISNTSIDRSFLPSLSFNTLQIFSIPSTRIAGPLAFPPKPLIFSPEPLIKIVL